MHFQHTFFLENCTATPGWGGGQINSKAGAGFFLPTRRGALCCGVLAHSRHLGRGGRLVVWPVPDNQADFPLKRPIFL